MPKESKESVPVTASKEEAKSLWPAIHPIAEMERIFDRLLNQGWPSSWRRRDTSLFDNVFEADGQRLPSLDVIDRDNELIARAELPGIEKKDLNITVTDNLLSIKAESSREVKEEKGDYFRHEISGYSFARSVLLPATVDATKTTASLKNGILEIILPKVEASKRQRIEIQ
jgi:HSP20 family protein